MSTLSSEEIATYGGQAVIEGVMMRGSQNVAIAMRAPDNQIIIHSEPLSKIYTSKLIKIPFLRGLIGLWDALGLGIRGLTISANTQTGEDEKLEGPALYITMGSGMALGIGIFLLVPAGLALLTEKYLEWNSWSSNLVEGLIRLALMIGYIWAVGFMPDIRRVFAYHGAEHKTINAYEAGAELTPENVARYSLEHPRCGTAFLLSLVLISIVLFSLLGPQTGLWKLSSRVLLLPVLAMLAYEYTRWTARHIHSPLVGWLVKPNLALQHLTTREPTLEMLEVSIAAFKAMRSQEATEKRGEN